MSKELIKDGYTIHVAQNAFRLMHQQFGLVVGRRNRYDLPEGFVPGANEDESKGYAPGSEIGTSDLRLYKCLRAERGKAVWFEQEIEITEGSYIEGEAQSTSESKPKAETKKKEPVKAEPEEDTKEKEELPSTPDIPINEPEPKKKELLLETLDIPFQGYLDKNGVMTMSQLLAIVEAEGLEDLKYFNPDRAGKVLEFLQENDYL